MTDPSAPPTDPTELRTIRPGDEVTVVLHGWAHGGEAVGRLPDGMACFVAYALPGETVSARITKRKKRWARADLLEVLIASPQRQRPPCAHYGPSRCGGCQLQHATPDYQLELKQRVLVEQLTRLGGITDPPVLGVVRVPGGWPDGYRAWARMAPDANGALGFRKSGSHDVHAVDECLLMTPETRALRRSLGDDWSGVEEVTLMAGTTGGTVTVDPGVRGVPGTHDGSFGLAIAGPRSTTVIRGPGSVTMDVGPVSLQVSAGSFFQAGPATATVLADLVVAAAGVVDGDAVLDLYAGVGLFSAFLSDDGIQVTAVESNVHAVADARVNLDGLGVRILGVSVEEALTEIDSADVIVLDPPRSGAGPDVCLAMIGLSPRKIIYVACDPAALARDARVLTTHGMVLESVQGVDAFGHTAHVEAVAIFCAEAG